MNFFKRASKGFYGYRPTNSLVTWLRTSITLLIVGGVLTLLRWDWFAVSWDWLNGDESNSATIRNIGLVIAGLIALPLAIWRTRVADRQASAAQLQVGAAQQQVDMGHQSLLNESYQQSAEMLGSNVLAVRMGGIYALQQLAHDHAGLYHLQIMNLFCAFVRRPPPDPEVGLGVPNAPRLRHDVQAIMDAIAARDKSRRALEQSAGFALDLRDSDLSGAQMDRDVFLDGRVLFASALIDQDLGPDRFRLEFSGAQLARAQLDRANLQNARLNGANLSGASLTNANLSGARLVGANLSGRVRLIGANLSDAVLVGADLSSASFYYTTLSGTDFGADGDDKSWSVTGLTQAMLELAIADPNNPPKLGGVVLDTETGEPLVWRKWRLIST